MGGEKSKQYDDALASRVRARLESVRSVEQKRMFGGIAFMVAGKLCVTVGKKRIMCRIDPAIHEEVLQRDGCRTVLMKGRQYRGYVYVDAEAVETKGDLEYWVGLALDYNSKAKTSTKRRGRSKVSS